jgi:hypothetical protein
MMIMENQNRKQLLLIYKVVLYALKILKEAMN